MLFDSYNFILVFLPLVVVGHLLLAQRAPSTQNIWLLSSSLFFYAWWDIRFVVLLFLSILSNYISALVIDHFRSRHVIRNFVFVSIILINMLILGYFKYALFVLSNLGALDCLAIGEVGILLPLGISFFTLSRSAISRTYGVVSMPSAIWFAMRCSSRSSRGWWQVRYSERTSFCRSYRSRTIDCNQAIAT